MLDEIRALCDGGDESDALDLLDDYLGEYPGDLEAILLKADLCLKLGRDEDFVAQAVVTVAQREPGLPALADLVARVDARVRDALANGRREIARERWGNALSYFSKATILAPQDPAVLLAAGRALGGFEETSEGERRMARKREDPESFLAMLLEERDAPSDKPREVDKAVEDYLKRAMEAAMAHSAPLNGSFDRLLAEARASLIRHWLARGQAGPVFELLDVYGPGDLADEISARLLGQILERIAILLRAGRQEQGAALLAECLPGLPDHPLVRLLRAEFALDQAALDDATAHYEAALTQLSGPPAAFDLTALAEGWRVVEPSPLLCARCARPLNPQDERCAYCAEPLEQVELLFDVVRQGQLPLGVGVRFGLAGALARQDQPDRAVEVLDAALGLLSEDSELRRDLEALRQTLVVSRQEAEFPALAVQVTADWQDAAALTPEVLAGIRLACEQEAEGWLAVPFFTRRALARALVRGGHFALARRVLALAFADNPARRSVQALAAELEEAVAGQVQHLLDAAAESLVAGRAQQALDLLDDLLLLAPDFMPALLLRGNAREAAGQDLLALQDFHRLVDYEPAPELRYQARICAARTLEGRFAFDAARAMLAPLKGAPVDELRAQLDRRQHGIPVVKTQRVTETVQEDRLTRVPVAPFYHGFFAVALRAVGRPLHGADENWQRHVLDAGFEFVQVLGGLQKTVAPPVFGLRIIAHPDAAVPERGQIRLVLLARVSAADEAACHQQALNLWEIVRSILPLSQENVFMYEPVSSAAELELLLEPFAIASMAQVVRREQAPSQVGDRYAVFPFRSGTPDVHNLLWALLRQPHPALVSIHLLPTALHAWERDALDAMMEGRQDTPAAAVFDDDEAEELTPWHQDGVSQWWQQSRRAGQVNANRYLMDSLDAQAYVMQVNVASSRAENALLPEMVGAALFSPANVSDKGVPYGGFEVMRSATGEEFEAGVRNLALLDVEGWVYSAAPQGASRLRHMVGETEAAMTFRWPVPGAQGVPGLRLVEARPVPPPAGLPGRGTVVGQSVARVNGVPLPIMQAVDDRRRHAYVVGKTGTGKSTLLKNMALQDIEAGRGVCVVDPHGDLIEDILERIPAYRMQDVIVFDPSDEERPIGLNLLQARTETERQRIVTEFIGLLMRMYDPTNSGIVGPRFQHNVRNAMLTAMAMEGATLVEVVRILIDPDFVRKVLPLVKDPIVRDYWQKQIANTSDWHKSEVLDYIVSKFSRFVGDSRIRNIIGQRETTLDFRAIMDREQVLLVNLSKGRIGPDSAQFLGLLLVQSLLITALSRAEQPRGERPDFFLYVDEFQNFATDLFATMLSEGRKYGIALTVANQYLTQLDHAIRDAIFGNVGSIVSFRLGPTDALMLAPEMYPIFNADDLLNLPKFTAVVKLLVEGAAARPFTVETLADLRPPDPARGAAIREYSRNRYGRDAAAVTADIMERYKQR